MDSEFPQPGRQSAVSRGTVLDSVPVLMNSVGTDVTAEKAREIIGAGLGAWNFSVDTPDPALYEKLRGVSGALPKIMAAIAAVREAGADFPGFRFNYMTVISRHNFRGLRNCWLTAWTRGLVPAGRPDGLAGRRGG